MKRLARTGFAALVLLILQPGIANAGTAGVTSHDHFTYLTYTASPGEANHVTITGANGTYTIHDTAGVTTGQDCARTDATTAICTQTTTNSFHGIWINSRDRRDVIRVQTDLLTRINAGGGNDRVYGGTEQDIMIGESDPTGRTSSVVAPAPRET